MSIHIQRTGRRPVARGVLLLLLAALTGSTRAAAQAPPSLPSGPQSFWATVEQKERSIYFAALENGDAENWFGSLVSPVPTEVTLTLTHLDPAAPSAAQLQVTLQGVTSDEAVSPDHRVAVFVNEQAVGELVFDGVESEATPFAVPHALLQEGANTVRLVAQGAVDYSLVDAVRLSYWHTYEADADRLRFTVGGGQPVHVRGFASAAIHLLDITDPAAPHEVAGTLVPEHPGSWAVVAQVDGPGTRTLLAFTDATVLAPAVVEANQPSALHADTQANDYLVITHDTFAESLQPLVALRAGQGHVAALVDIEDLLSLHTFVRGTRLLTRAQTRWRRPPAFVVLAGDATVDPRDYAGFGDADFVPTKMVAMDSVTLESATDEWFGDLDDDGLAELALGRLPMRTVAHAETMVAKLVGYEQAAAGAWTKQVVLLTDADEPTWSFEADSATLAAALPADYTAHEVFGGAGTAAARAALFDRVAQGQLLVNYLGHGSTTVWGKNADLLARADVTDAWHPGTRLPVVVAMNCLNGLFQGIYGEESLAEAFLRAPEGAVATWASSSLTYAAPQAAANQAFFRLTFQGAYATLGETVVAAKRTVSDRDVRRSWIFFGDPAMRLKGVPSPTDARDPLPSTPTSRPLRTAADTVDAAPADPDDTGTTGEGETPDATAQHLADFDGDGRDDLFTYAPDTGTWTLALADANTLQDVTGTWAAHAQLVVAHLNHDRLADVFAYNETTGEWFQALNAADGSFTTQAGTWAPGWQVTVGDLRGTGQDDVFLSDPNTGIWFQAAPTGAGGFTYRSGQGLPVGDVRVADFNGDRYADLFVYDSTSGRWFFGVNDTAGGFTYVGGDGAPDWRVHVANLDGNPWTDLFFFHPASGAWVEWRTDTAWRLTYAQGTWTPGGAVTVADGDGRDDLVWYDARSGQWASHVNRGPGTYTAATGVWPAERSLAVGDLNGDGRDDLFFYDATTGAWSRYLTAPAQNHSVVLTEDSGTWATGLALVGRPE